MKIRFTLLLLLVGLFILPSCLPEINTDPDNFNGDWTPGFAIPLLDVDLSLQDALDNFETGGFVTTDPDNLLIVVYRSNRISITGGQLFSLPDVQLPLLDSLNTIPVPYPSPVELENINLKQGQMIFSVSSLETQSVAIDFSLPDFTQNGVVYSSQYNLPASDGMTPSVVSDTVDMLGMNLSFAGGDFRANYRAVRADGQHLQMSNIGLELLNMDYSYIDGYVGNPTLNFASGLSKIDLFQDWNQGNIQFEDPKVKFTFNNSFGLPIRLNVDSFSVNTKFNGSTVFQSQDLSNGVDMGFPSLAEVGQSVETVVTLDANNSNIADILSNVPYEFYYDIEGLVNPDNDPNIDNFITDSSKLEVSIDFELPMYGSIGQFSLRDTVDFNFNDYSEFASLKVRSVTQNGFPFEVSFQAYFLDENNVLIDSMFTESSLPPILAAASVDANGNVTAPVSAEAEADFDEARYSNLKDNVQKMVITAYIETTNNGNTPVKIFTDYTVSIQMGAIARL